MTTKPNGANVIGSQQANRKAQSLLKVRNGIWIWASAHASPSMTLKDVRDITASMEQFLGQEIDAHYAAGMADRQAEIDRDAAVQTTTEAVAEPS